MKKKWVPALPNMSNNNECSKSSDDNVHEDSAYRFGHGHIIKRSI